MSAAGAPTRAIEALETGDTWAMSTASLHLVRSLFATWARGDFSSVEWADPEVEFVIADGPALASWTGLAGLAEGFRDYLSAWKGYGVEADELRELDGERVLVLVHRSERGKTSGLELGQMASQGAGLFHLRGGKVTRLVAYFDREHALAELGLAPQAQSP